MYRSTYRYESKAQDQTVLKMRIKEITSTRVRYGYRRIHVLLKREGWEINHKRAYRIYREEGLNLRHKSKSKKVSGYVYPEKKLTPETNAGLWILYQILYTMAKDSEH
jgi:putative transposase